MLALQGLAGLLVLRQHLSLLFVPVGVVVVRLPPLVLGPRQSN